MAEVIGENIDRIATVEIRSKTPPRGVIHRLYNAARRRSPNPLTLSAAREIVGRIKSGDHVFIATGAGGWPNLPKGETDGPPGAASLARALDLGLGAKPVLFSDEHNLEPIIASCEAAGMTVRIIADDRTLKVRPHSALVLPFPSDHRQALERSRELLDAYQPQAVIAIERLGPNGQGIFHSVRGFRIDCAPLNLLVEEARGRKLLTVGIGDNGNEIGCGLIYDDVREIQPRGRVCQCPCQAGMATVAKTDFLIVASVSNWGAYGVAACMAYLQGEPDLLHDAYMEKRMVEACVDAGGVDGELGMQVPSVDGISMAVQQSIVTIMGEVVKRGLRGLRTEVTYTKG